LASGSSGVKSRVTTQSPSHDAAGTVAEPVVLITLASARTRINEDSTATLGSFRP
jgi:hypothetical protein